MMGAIMCLGVATANSVVVVTFARNNLKEGMTPLKAAWEAGTGRLRPVLMTALAMIIGMVPMALGLGDGGEQNARVGRAVIGGLVLATVATLTFVPALFSIMHRSTGARQAAGGGAAAHDAPGAPRSLAEDGAEASPAGVERPAAAVPVAVGGGR